MPVNGKRVSELKDALLDAFSRSELTQLLRTKFGMNLNHIASSYVGEKDAFDQVVDAAAREGWIADLVQAAAEARPKRPDLQQLRDAFLAADSGRAGDSQELLPYLCDRGLQDHTLGVQIEQLRGQPDRRPLICIVHGNDEQCHFQYADRLDKELLPKLFGLDKQREQLKRYDLSWPPTGIPTAEFEGYFTREVAERFGKPLATNLKELGESVKVHNLVFMNTYLATDNWRMCGTVGFERFLRFWTDWPDLSTGHGLVVCVQVEYLPPARGFRRWLANLFPALAPRRKTNAFLQTYLGTPSPLVPPAGVNLLVLPELRDVTRLEALQWVGKWVPNNCSRGCVADRVGSLYEGYTAIPLKRLAGQLRSLLTECCTC